VRKKNRYQSCNLDKLVPKPYNTMAEVDKNRYTKEKEEYQKRLDTEGLPNKRTPAIKKFKVLRFDLD
jgi:hypothetical protein